MVALGERLQAAMKARGATVSRVAQAVGMSYQGIKKIVNGGTQSMSAANYIAVADYLKISSEWLRTGEGTMDLVQAAPSPERTVSESQWALLQDFEMLPEDEKKALRTTMKAKADNVRRIVNEYLGRQGVTGSATDARVAESYGAPPAPPAPATAGAASYRKITPIPEEPNAKSKKAK